ncbi:MAG: flagellar basal body rod protein FlgC [bacterium]
MADLITSLSYSASGMEAQAARLRHVSENISNADTPGYHRKLMAFHEDLASGEVTAGPVTLDRSQLASVFDPGNPLSDATGHYDGSNVDLVVEIADAREAQRSYEANLKIFDQARQMTQSLFELLRR